MAMAAARNADGPFQISSAQSILIELYIDPHTIGGRRTSTGSAPRTRPSQRSDPTAAISSALSPVQVGCGLHLHTSRWQQRAPPHWHGQQQPQKSPLVPFLAVSLVAI